MKKSYDLIQCNRLLEAKTRRALDGRTVYTSDYARDIKSIPGEMKEIMNCMLDYDLGVTPKDKTKDQALSDIRNKILELFSASKEAGRFKNSSVGEF